MDHLYKKLFQSLNHLDSTEKDIFMAKAGYFTTSGCSVEDIPSYDPKFVCTPFESLIGKIVDTKKPAIVLLCTGSFAPMHDGHISMIQTAINALEKDYSVVGVYVSPGHDEYVLTKNGTDIFTTEDRLQLAGDLIQKHNKDWMVDPWESFYAGFALNFTEVLQRLKHYLSFHLKQDINVAFCFGADNAGFTHVLKGIPHVCVSRNKGTMPMQDKGIFATHELEDISSTKVRLNMASKKIAKKNISIREHDNSMIPVLEKHVSYFNIIPWNKQGKYDSHVINLDSQSKGIFDYDLEISRAFMLADIMNESHFVQRPESDDVSHQIKKIPAGDYILFDDDIHTGKTVAYVKNLLSPKINIVGVKTLLEKDEERIDILDERDFLFQEDYAGLVVMSHNRYWRIPYIYPFVNIYRRANILRNGKELSIEVLKKNILRLKGYKAKDINNGFFVDVCGYSLDHNIEDILMFYITCLENS